MIFISKINLENFTILLLNHIRWNDKIRMSPKSKTRVYKTCIWSIITYGADSWADTTYTEQLLTIEMRVLEISRILEMNSWTWVCRREWAAHVDKMNENRLAKIVRNFKPEGPHYRGRPKKLWHQFYL